METGRSANTVPCILDQEEILLLRLYKMCLVGKITPKETKTKVRSNGWKEVEERPRIRRKKGKSLKPIKKNPCSCSLALHLTVQKRKLCLYTFKKKKQNPAQLL